MTERYIPSWRAIEITEEMIDECCESFKIGNLEYPAGRVLREIDPACFRQEVLSYLDSLGLTEDKNYADKCSICGVLLTWENCDEDSDECNDWYRINPLG